RPILHCDHPPNRLERVAQFSTVTMAQFSTVTDRGHTLQRRVQRMLVGGTLIAASSGETSTFHIRVQTVGERFVDISSVIPEHEEQPGSIRMK
ncbi:hypothetical protein, partial [Pseudarthrobacter scleromae]|uniref:hypothetical protein n=1 Tax=Pseudarthrobacter scleromae TaxID=158897 RepID=UPI003D023435